MSLPKKLGVLAGLAILYALASYGLYFIYILVSWVLVSNMCSNGCFDRNSLVNQFPLYVLAAGFVAGATWGVRWLLRPDSRKVVE